LEEGRSEYIYDKDSSVIRLVGQNQE